MNFKVSVLPTLLLLPILAVPSLAQNVGRVAPASLPLPLPAGDALAPDVLRARNPWNLPVTGTWKFQLTHGRIDKAKQFVPENASALDASSRQGENIAANAFDSDLSTRWCASNGDFPQWIQADLGQVRRVQSIGITWEKPETRYQYRIEGRKENKGAWTTLADKTAPPGVGSGPITIQPADARYVRVLATAATGGQWACIREMKLGILAGGQTTNWQPPTEKAVKSAPAVRDAFAATGFNDANWDNVPVPSNWEMLGYSIPTYDSVDNTVGLYRRTIAVPTTWAGKRVYWHFDGALDGAEVWVNGQKAGYHESGYTAFQVDVTDFIKAGQLNLLAVRVSKTTPSFDADTGDYQSMGGIYRETSLIAVPQTHVSDITVTTPLAANYRDATLNTQVQISGTAGEAVQVRGRLVESNGQATKVKLSGAGTIGADGTATVSLSAPVAAPKLWSAEKPNLYYVVLELSSKGKPVERVEQRFGFRQIETKGNVVLWNGQPIKCTGVCRHDFWSDKGFALTEANWKQDLEMMKAANINAIRTSHYNHAARFMELCDEKGMYVLDEVPYCWINDQVKDAAYAPFLMQRAQETIARDKNNPSVLAWSLGNENPMGIASQMTLDLVKKLDPTRPAFVSQQDPESAKGQEWKDSHYPGPDTVDRDAAQTRWPVNYSEHPHTFYEKDAQQYDPGVSDLWSETLIKTWNKIWPAPSLLGAFIWEWQNQGVADKNDDKTKDFYFGLDHLRQENNKGIVTGDRVPKPELWFVKMAYSPIDVGARTVSPKGATCSVPLTNHYSFTDLSELTCRWTAMDGAKTLKSGTMRVNCAPMQSVTANFPAPAGLTMLRLEFVHPDGRTVMGANLRAQGAPLPAPAAMATGNTLTTQDGNATLRVANNTQQIVFDKASGTIRSWRVGNRNLLIGGPILNLGEAKEVNENGYFRSKKAPVTTNAKVKTMPGIGGAVRVVTVSQVLNGAGGAQLGTLTSTYDIAANAEMRVAWKMQWTADDTRLWESGLKLPVPTDFTRMSWLRDSYFLDYPAGHIGEPSGTCDAQDVQFRASKRDLHWLTLTNKAGFGVALLPQDGNLVSRANLGQNSTMLFASSAVAGLRGLSGRWVEDHTINAKKGESLSGTFLLRAINGPNRVAAAQR